MRPEDGSAEEASRPPDPVPAAAALRPEELRALGGSPGRATLLQFSTAFCAPCRTTRGVLRRVAGLVDGVAHVEVDAEGHLDLVRRLGVTATPVTLLLDGRGVERGRAAGVPTAPAVLTALAPLLHPDEPLDGEEPAGPDRAPCSPPPDAPAARSLPSA